MSEMIELVARAICRTTILGDDLQGKPIFDNPDYVIPAQSRADRVPIIRWKLYVEQARAAIEAVRDYLNRTGNSSLNYTADELDLELRE